MMRFHGVPTVCLIAALLSGSALIVGADGETSAIPAAVQTPAAPATPKAPFTQLPQGPTIRFYNLSFPMYDPSLYETPFQSWYAKYSAARAARSSFVNLDDYDAWFLTLEGAGVEIGRKMKDVYLAGMPSGVKAEYDALMSSRERWARRHKPGQGVAGGVADGLDTIVVKGIVRSGDRMGAMLSGGELVFEGDVFSTTYKGRSYSWKVDSVTWEKALFSPFGLPTATAGQNLTFLYLLAGPVVVLIVVLVWFLARRKMLV